MNIQERKVTVRELAEDYFNDAEEGVVGYGERFAVNRLIEEDKNKGVY